MFSSILDLQDMRYTMNTTDNGMTFVLEPASDLRFDLNVLGMVASGFSVLSDMVSPSKCCVEYGLGENSRSVDLEHTRQNINRIELTVPACSAS